MATGTISAQQWQQSLDRLKEDAILFGYSVAKACPNAIHNYLLTTLAHGITIMQGADPLKPHFVPYLNHVFNLGIPNQDTTYYYVRIDGRNSYRVTGIRGTVGFIEFQAGSGYHGIDDKWAQSLNNATLKDFEVKPDGTFDIVLSATRPEGYSGNWMPIDTSVEWLLVRQIAHHPGETDARLAILLEEGDATTELSASEQLDLLVSMVKGQARLWVGTHEEMHRSGACNRFISANWSENSIVIDQLYQHGLYDIKGDQALIVSVREPSSCDYWGIQLASLLGQSHDFIHRQTCLNGHVDRADSDGATRFVLSHHDPGVANWLDLCGQQQGYMLLRWLKPDVAPEPQTRKVALDSLQSHLPPDTRRVTPEERARALREQATAIQLRRMW